MSECAGYLPFSERRCMAAGVRVRREMAGAGKNPRGGKRPSPIRNAGKHGQGAINAHRLFGGGAACDATRWKCL